MPLLDGTIDKLIEEEQKNIHKYLRGAVDLKIEINGNDKKIIEKAGKE